MQKEKTSCKTLTQNVNIRTDARMDERMDGQTDKQTERRKLYTPRHTLYAGGIINVEDFGF